MTQTSATSCSTVPTVRFSTEMFAPRERIAAWREFIGLKVLKLDIEPHSAGEFYGESTLYNLPDLRVFIGGGTAALYDRPNHLVTNDDFIFNISIQGRSRYGGPGPDVIAGLGDAVWTGGGESGFKDAPEDTRSISFMIPKRAIASDLINAHDSLGRCIPAQTPALRLLRHYLRVLDDPDRLDTLILQQHFSAHMRDLIALAVGATRDAAETAKARGGHAARLHAIITAIDAHLANPQLSAAWLGVRLGLSERYVHYLLARAGLTFSELVRCKRAERARQILERPTGKPLRIVDVAFAVGFSDLSTFNRAFRQRYDCTPTDVLRGSWAG